MQTQSTAPMRKFTRTPTISGAYSETAVLPREELLRNAQHTLRSYDPERAEGATMEGPARKEGVRSHLQAAKRYLVAAVACAAFALIYAQFSHGVYSPFMTYMFAIPLVGGSAVALGLRLAHVRELSRGTRQAWALALSTLTVASCLRGVFDIAGTSSPLLIAYPIAAAVFAIVAAVNLRR